jgi:hypothetical protein
MKQSAKNLTMRLQKKQNTLFKFFNTRKLRQGENLAFFLCKSADNRAIKPLFVNNSKSKKKK